MDKMRMESVDMTSQNIERIGALFPNCITETMGEDGKMKKAINFDLLRQMLSGDVLEGAEAYEFTWVGKKAAIVEANKPIRKTLRPCKEESVNWDTTENLYIEGDNLEVLKLLQESYLGKVKMIYIDPPYNTGNDFIYNDSFKISKNDYNEESEKFDELGNKYVKNIEANGRFHSDWCSMIYSRLLLARNLLSDDGVIFISIDENERANINKVIEEVFGKNVIGEVIRKTKSSTNDSQNGFNLQHESLLVCCKNIKKFGLLRGEKKDFSKYKNLDNDPNGSWISADPSAKSGSEGTYFEITNPITGQIDLPPSGRFWAFSKQTLEKYIAEGKIKFKVDKKAGERGFIFKRYLKQVNSSYSTFDSLNSTSNEFMNQVATKELQEIFPSNYFSYPKPVHYLYQIVKSIDSLDFICMDFFAGSSTTAHALMKLNAEDGGNRKFIMVQLPEPCNEKSEAFKAGYKNICEIGKERIRRAAKKIAENNPNAKFDGGFRVFKVDESNMKDVYYAPADYSQDLLDALESNIKEDRTDLDLFFGCILDWGLPLNLSYTSESIKNCSVHSYSDNALIACFNDNIPESVIKEIAKRKPLRVVFRDSSFADTPSKINVTEIFKLLSPDTSVKVI